MSTKLRNLWVADSDSDYSDQERKWMKLRKQVIKNKDHPPKLSNVQMMELRSQYKRLILRFEDTYRRDYGVHLYSLFLVHQVKPNFPHKTWGAWPIAYDTVPVPRWFKHGMSCVDEPEDTELGETDTGFKRKFNYKKDSHQDDESPDYQTPKRRKKDFMGPEEKISNEPKTYIPELYPRFNLRPILPADETNPELDRVKAKISTKHRFFKGKLPTPATPLRQQIDAAYKRTISKLFTVNKRFHRFAQPSTEIHTPEALYVKILERLNGLVKNWKPSRVTTNFTGLRTWRDVAIANDQISDDRNSNAMLSAKYEQLFKNVASLALRQYLKRLREMDAQDDDESSDNDSSESDSDSLGDGNSDEDLDEKNNTRYYSERMRARDLNDIRFKNLRSEILDNVLYDEQDKCSQIECDDLSVYEALKQKSTGRRRR